jgi:hypothetical protein
MKTLVCFFILFILLPASSLTTPAQKEQKSTVKNLTNVHVKKTKFIVPKEILAIINIEKTTVFRTTHENTKKNNVAQQLKKVLPTQEQKCTIQSTTDTHIKKKKFIVPKEILAIINIEKATVFRTAYDNAMKIYGAEQIDEKPAKSLATKAANKCYKHEYKETKKYKYRLSDEYKDIQHGYKTRARDKKNIQEKELDITTDIETHVKELLIEATKKSIHHEKIFSTLPEFLFEENELNLEELNPLKKNNKNHSPINFETCFNDDFLETTDLEFSTYDSDLDDKDFEFTQDIDINTLKDVLAETIEQKKRK